MSEDKSQGESGSEDTRSLGEKFADAREKGGKALDKLTNTTGRKAGHQTRDEGDGHKEDDGS